MLSIERDINDNEEIIVLRFECVSHFTFEGTSNYNEEDDGEIHQGEKVIRGGRLFGAKR